MSNAMERDQFTANGIEFDRLAETMGIELDATIDVTGAGRTESGYHRHMAIKWEGGVIWLDMMMFENLDDPHYCIDIRQFNPSNEMKGQGVFTIVNGRRSTLNHELEDTEKRVVKGHRFDGGYVISILTDPHGREATAIKPSDGNG